MGGKFVVKAGQHIFENGESVVVPVTVLPTAPNDYSRKFFIPTSAQPPASNIKVGKPTHIVGLKADDYQPIFFENLESKNTSDENVKTNRFYTAQATDAIVHLFVDLPVMNIHESEDEELNG